MSKEQTYLQDQDTRTVTLRECPYCNEAIQSQGLYAHVMNSQDSAHGEYRSVPSGFNPREAAIIGEQQAEPYDRTSASRQDETQNWLYLCTLCGGMFKGDMGYKVHLAKSAGDDLHPQGVDVDDDHYVRIPADEDWEPTIPEDRLEEITEKEMSSAQTVTRGSQEGETQEPRGSVPISELEQLVSKFRGKGESFEDAEEDVEDVIDRYQ